MVRRPSRRVLFICAASLALLSIGGAAVSTLFFVRGVFPRVGFPIVEFDEGVERTVRVPPDADAMVLWMVVDDVNDPVPPLRVDIHDASGADVRTSDADGWAKLLGRSYRRITNIHADGGSEIVLKVTTQNAEDAGTADFAVFRHTGATLDRQSAAWMPYWLASGAVGVLAIALLFAAILSHTDETP